MVLPSTLRPATCKQVLVGYVCWSLVQLTLGELIHKVGSDQFELGCIDGEKFLKTLDFIVEILVGGVVGRSYRHGSLEQGLAHAVPGPLGCLFASVSG